MRAVPDGAPGHTLWDMDLVLVDDHPAVRAGLRGLLDDEEDLRVVATAATAREGFEAIADLQPELALVDHHLPDDDGLSLCLRTRALPAPPRVVVYSAFAAVAIHSTRILGVDPDIVNVNGGALALGHPVGASGARILTTLLYELKRRGGGKGLAAICSGGGQGDAVLVEV